MVQSWPTEDHYILNGNSVRPKRNYVAVLQESYCSALRLTQYEKILIIQWLKLKNRSEGPIHDLSPLRERLKKTIYKCNKKKGKGRKNEQPATGKSWSRPKEWWKRFPRCTSILLVLLGNPMAAFQDSKLKVLKSKGNQWKKLNNTFTSNITKQAIYMSAIMCIYCPFNLNS